MQEIEMDRLDRLDGFLMRQALHGTDFAHDWLNRSVALGTIDPDVAAWVVRQAAKLAFPAGRLPPGLIGR